MPYIEILFLIPLIASCVAFFLPVSNTKAFRLIGVALSVLPLIYLLSHWHTWLGSEINLNWVPPLGIHFHLKMDGLAFLFVALTCLIVPISILAVPSFTLTHPNTFYGLVLLVQGLLIGFFLSRDLLLFTIFYESMIIPLYFMISIWGGENRKAAALQFLVYMIAGSALMVAAVLALYFSAGTFDLDVLAKSANGLEYAHWLAAAFLLAFAVKTPLFPFHAWLPDAYTQASTTGTILLSGLLSKAGIFGILRIVLELFPDVMKEWSPYLLGLAIAGVFYGGFAAWMQWDYKRLIAFSSLSHVNFILAGLFIWAQPAKTGAILQAINHGVTITALFLVAGWLEDRTGTTAISKEGGMGRFLPYLCWLTLFFVLASIALPGLNNFVGELLILFGLFKENVWVAGFLALSVILSAIYMLNFMKKVYFGPPTFFKEAWIDIGPKEWGIALPLIAIIIWLGIYPTPVFNLLGIVR